MTSLNLRAYLDSRRVTSADWNLTGLGRWIGKYRVPEEEYESFLGLMHDHVFTKGFACCILEKHKKHGPILVDLDFKYAAGGPLRRRFTEQQVREFVAAYADAVARFTGSTTEPLRFFVSVKPSPELDPAHEAHKDGIHIVCPTLTTSPEFQCAIRGYLLQTGAIERIFGSTGATNAAQEILDLSVIRPNNPNNWFVYGACKPDKAYYKVEHVYSVAIPAEYVEITPEDLVEEALDQWDAMELVKHLSLRWGHDAPTALMPRPEAAADWRQLLQRWGTGSNFARSLAPPSPATQHGGGEEPAPLSLDGATEMVQLSGLSVRTPPTDSDIRLAYRLVSECLDPVKRAKNYPDWVALGILLHNISNSDQSRDVWAAFSRRAPGCSGTPDSVYHEKWRLLPAELSAIHKGRKMLMMGTLLMWAKIDSPVKYEKIREEANTTFAIENSAGTHDAIANQVLQMYREEFRCTPPKKGSTATTFEWYQYPEGQHSWRALMTWTTLRSRLGNDVRDVYLLAERKLIDRQLATTDESEKERLAAQQKNISKIKSQLQTTGFKECVMKEVTDKFYEEDFLKHMNQDATLMGFENGVLELRATGDDGRPHVKFRPGRPDDCISFQMGRGMIGLDAIPYIPYDPANPTPQHLAILDFFTKIYPDPVLREYCLTLFSACLEGVNREQKFYIMSGKGGNGKSAILELMGKTFGEYQDSLSATALTRKRADAGSANPEFIDLKAKRFVSMVEPEEGEKINTSLMKQLSGQDMLKVRGLYKSQEGFIFTARIFMSCNDLPGVSSMDNGTWRRIRVIPHIAEFVEDGKPTNPAAHIHPRDPQLDAKIVSWRPYFASILVWYYENRYLRGGLKEPAQVTEASNKYKEENDAFAAFAQDSLVREVGAELRASDMLVRYKEWMRYNPGKKTMQKPALLLKMAEIYGVPIEGGKVFAGVRLALDGEDLSGNTL